MLIGKHLTIREAHNKSLEGLSGEVIDETKHTITMRVTGHTDKKIIKEQIITFEETL